jgi:hypothetical protein
MISITRLISNKKRILSNLHRFQIMSYFVNPFITQHFPYLNYRLWGLLENIFIMLALTFKWPIVCLIIPLVSGSLNFIYIWQLY